MIGIYGIFRKSDDKCMYVGESKDVRTRIKHHLWGNTKNLFNKEEYYGDVIEEHMINNKQFRLEREAYWIEQLKPELNIVRDETNRGEYFSGENSSMYGKTGEKNHMFGKHRSEETKKKIGAAHKGKHRSEETKKNISESLKGKPSRTNGTKWINNGVTNKRVKPDELHQYLNNGWKFGRIKST